MPKGPHPKKYLIFDLDETLIRLEIDWSGVYKMLFTAIKNIDSSLISKVPESALEFYNLVNMTTSKHGEKAKKKLDQTIAEYEMSHYLRYTPNPSLMSFIRTHKDTYSFSLWTSNAKRTIRDFLQKEQFEQFFENIITLESVLLTKPNTYGFSMIYNSNNSKRDYLMIGDRAP
ncbi:hypothetical protein COV87_03470 [Candidatus Roizmanbacteria bacterium CG11_big_fil_rev_8_21_14_0_20_37_16]|uniref:FCP1 homology domain-containing protein n=2 Tax=Candidatus Roizmaniibacteriota TaxID=1752723 RepID=A0A2H0KJK0_9BACT|nr:MAG: hypothetical protein COV87_03470 [Candidatus Roizmanbacteria bacterium CG11_big_fil_rev_8_21_14_0_20_37_16]